MNKQDVVDGLKKFVGLPNTPEVRDMVTREVIHIDSSKKQFSDEEVIEVAKAINGPHRELPEGAKYTLSELREHKWAMISKSERATCINQAVSVLNHMVNSFHVIEKFNPDRKETVSN